MILINMTVKKSYLICVELIKTGQFFLYLNELKWKLHDGAAAFASLLLVLEALIVGAGANHGVLAKRLCAPHPGAPPAPPPAAHARHILPHHHRHLIVPLLLFT